MKANISIVTLGVQNVATSTAFYTKLGWKNTKASNPNITFLQGHSIVLSLFERGALAKDAATMKEDEPPVSGFRGVTLAINMASPADVDSYFAQATGPLMAGGKVVKIPQKVFWGGYSGYFADPDGHLWEVAHNPFVVRDEHGQLTLEALSTTEESPTTTAAAAAAEPSP